MKYIKVIQGRNMLKKILNFFLGNTSPQNNIINDVVNNSEDNDSNFIYNSTYITFDESHNLENLIQKSYPSKNGLYPHEILVLKYAPTYFIGETNFQKFWLHDYGIKDLNKILNKLLNKGFLCETTIYESLERETLISLKEILKKHNLKISGNKPELIERLILNLSNDKVKLYFPKTYYKNTELGDKELKENEYISYIHKNKIIGLDIWKLNQLMNEEPKRTYRDKIWSYLNLSAFKYFDKYKFGEYRSSRFALAKFIAEEKKYKQALYLISEVIFLDINGLSFFGKKIYPETEFLLNNFLPYESSFLRIPSGIVKITKEYIELSNLSIEEIKQTMLESMKKTPIFIKIFSPEECIDIFFMEINEEYEKLNLLYERAYNKLKIKFK